MDSEDIGLAIGGFALIIAVNMLVGLFAIYSLNHLFNLEVAYNCWNCLLAGGWAVSFTIGIRSND